MAPTGPIKNIAVVGSTGNIGKVLTEALLATGRHTITALTRAESKRTPPAGAKTIGVDFESEDSLASALAGQEFLIITLAPMVPDEVHTRIVRAAARAGVAYVMPNVWGADVTDPRIANDPFNGAKAMARAHEVRDLGGGGRMAFVAMASGFWYHVSMAMGEPFFGFDIPGRKAVMVDDGLAKKNVSTWPKCAETLVALLGLPESGAEPCVADWKNKSLYVSSFHVSQRDMLDSLHRVLGTTDADWDIQHIPSDKRIADGLAEVQQGNRLGFARALYASGLKHGGHGDTQKAWEAQCKILRIPEEDLDEETKEAVVMTTNGWVQSYMNADKRE